MEGFKIWPNGLQSFRLSTSLKSVTVQTATFRLHLKVGNNAAVLDDVHIALYHGQALESDGQKYQQI